MESPVFAIDGVNGILVTGSDHVIFFLLSRNKMVMTSTFVYENLGSRPSVAIFGRVAVVGNPHENVVYTYEQNDNMGLWEEVVVG